METKKILITCSLLLAAGVSQLHAQQNTLSSGGNASGAGGSVSYSIGQIDYISSIGTGGTITQGVQQPIEIFTAGIEDNAATNLSVSIYPNPSNEYVSLKIDYPTLKNVSFSLFDAQGKLVVQQIVTEQTTNISVQTLNSGVYFLNIYDSNIQRKQFKLIKN